MTRVRVESRFGQADVTFQGGQYRRELHYPPWKCACCGARPETYTLLIDKKIEEHITYKFPTWVPSCELCKKHQKITTQRGELYSLGCLLVFIIVSLVLVGVFRVTEATHWFLIIVASEAVCVAAYLRLWWSWGKRDILDAQAFMTPSCTGARFVYYQREPPNPFAREFTDIFLFANDAYAREFCQINRGTLG